MRLFVALELPESVRLGVADLLARLRRDLPPARWSRGENVHLTLVFLGATEPARLPALTAALHAVFARHPEQRVAIGGGGVFPSARRARVLWLGLDGGSPLTRLQLEVATAAASSLGREREERPFRPHLTLGRCRQPWRRQGVERFLAAARLAADELTLRHGTLFESHLGSGGARYEARETFPLGSDAVGVAS